MLYLNRDRLLVPALAVMLAIIPIAPRAEDAGHLAQALDRADARDWSAAQAQAALSGPMAVDLVTWQRLRAGQGSWPEYLDFARRNPDWPGMALLYRRGDALLTPGLASADVVGWFGDRAPDTLNGANALIAALDRGDRQRARQVLADFWVHQPMTQPEADAFVQQYGKRLGGLHDARLAALLDQGEWRAAEVTLPLASPSAQALGRARIATQAGRAGVDDLILSLPQSQRDDAGLALDRFDFRARAKLRELAETLMLERSLSAEALGQPERWAPLRADYARAAMRRGDWMLAESLAAPHFLEAGSPEFADLEWLAGYAALRAGAPDRALRHFRALQAGVGGPISVSRAFYWQGRAQEAAGQDAQAAYAMAAEWQGSYYGQLAAEKLGQPMQAALAVPGRAIETLPEWRGSSLRYNRVWQAGAWLIAAGDYAQAQRFFLHLAETAPPEDIGRMARLMMEVEQPWYALRLAKVAGGKGVIYPAAYFPLTGLERGGFFGLPPELVMAISRQESEFNPAARSHVGARGLMQVMPETATRMARMIGEPFDLSRLTEDADYNARIGSAYLMGLRDRFGASIALTASGYNAGPGRPARWLGDFGDLRTRTDPVDWVEMIPFDETRNYVMRVAEALPIYRARIAGAPVAFTPTHDLTGGGVLPMPITLDASRRPPISQRAMLALGAGGVLARVVPTAPTQASAITPGSDVRADGTATR